ncbi:MAG TPA: branched-chain amino acid ABC transporter permease, partial [Casimicrobiaceae bacterium]
MVSVAEVGQLLVNGVMAGTILAVPAIGLTAIYAVLRFPNFALASHATIGAFAGYVANAKLGLPLVPAVLVAFAVAGIVGVVSDETVLKRFRPAGYITTAIASIALTIALENVVRFAFGNELRGYDLPIQRDFRVGVIRVGPQQLVNLAIAGVAMAALFGFLAF